MSPRPKLRIELTTNDKLLEALGIFGIILIWGITIFSYQHLPQIIPTHYNLAGTVDSTGDKSTIWSLPVIATILFVGLTFLNSRPHVFNYPAKISQQNALQHYTLATRFLRFLKLNIVLIFLLIECETIYIAEQNNELLGVFSLPTILTLVLIPSLVYLLKIKKID